MHDLYAYGQQLRATKKIPTTTEYLNVIRPAFMARLSIGNCPVQSVYVGFIVAATLLYGREKFDHLTPPPAFADLIEQARYRDLIKKEIQRLEHVEELIATFTREMVELFCNFTSSLPLIAIQTAPPDKEVLTTVPLIDVINVPEVLAALIKPFYARTDLFASIQEVLLVNHLQASGQDIASYKPGKLVAPRYFKGTPAETAHAYLKNTPFEDIFDIRIPFSIPEQARFEHHWIVAGTGHGKTQTIQSLICRDLQAVADGAASIVVIDSQGDLIKNVAGLKLFAEGQPLDGKLCLIDPTDIEFPVQLNLFSLGTERLDSYSKLDRERLLNSIIELYDFVLAALLGAEMTSKQDTVFGFVTRALLQIPNATIHTLLELMRPGGDQKYQEHISKLHGAARSFFANEFTTSQFNETKRQVVRRLYGMLQNQTFERMFSHPKNKLDIFQEMNSGKVILINAAKDLLKQNGTEVFGRFFIALITQAAAERATLESNERLPTFVYIDECQDYIAKDSNFTVILEQARKQNVGLIVAHQYLTQLSQKTLDGLHALTTIKFAGGVSDRDAHALARDMRTTPGFLENQSKGSFAAFVRNMTPHAVSLDIPFGQLEDQERMTLAEQAAVRDRMRAQYAVSYAEVQQRSAEPAPAPTADPEEFADRY